MWLFLWMAIIGFLGEYVTITGIVILIISGLLLSGIFMIIYRMRIDKHLQKPFNKFNSIDDYELYFIWFLQIIFSNDEKEKIIKHGVLYNHMDFCTQEGCECQKIKSDLDEVENKRI